MFQVQEEMNRAERIAATAAATAAAGASPSASPAASPSTSPQPITAGGRRSPEQQRERKLNEKRLRCSPNGSASPAISDTLYRVAAGAASAAAAAATILPGGEATPRSSAEDAAAVSAPEPPQPARRKQQQGSPQQQHGPLSRCPAGVAAEAATASPIGKVGAQDREGPLPPPLPTQGAIVPSGGGSPVSSPRRQGLKYREYAAGVSAPSSPAKNTAVPGKDGKESLNSSSKPMSSRCDQEAGMNGGASAAAVAAATETGDGGDVESESITKPSTAISASCPLVAPAPASIPQSSGLRERPLRSEPESKPTWTSPKCVGKLKEDAAPESTPSRLVLTLLRMQKLSFGLEKVVILVRER